MLGTYNIRPLWKVFRHGSSPFVLGLYIDESYGTVKGSSYTSCLPLHGWLYTPH